MPIRLSGINSGLDTDALVKELVSAYSLKTQKYEKQQTKLGWKKDAWQSLNTKIYGLYTNISNLRYDSAYTLKKTSISDSTKASVTASGTAVSGTQKLKITSTAQACYVTGGKLGDNIKGSTKLSELGISEDSVLKINKGSGENIETLEVSISKDDTVSSLMKKLGEKGLNANFDENNHRVYISAKESGTSANFTLASEEGDDGVKTLITALGLADPDESVIKYMEEQAEACGIDLTAWNAFKSEGEEDSAAVARYTDIVTKYESAQKEVEKATAHYNASEAAESIVIAVKEKFTGENDFTAKDLMNAVNDGKSVKEFLEEKGIKDEETISQLETLSTSVENSVKDYGKINTELNLDEAKTNAEAALSDLSADDYANAKDALAAKAKVDSYGENVRDIALGNKTVGEVLSTRDTATRVEGKDATIVLNGVEYTSASNSFNINGLTIEAHAVTTDEITITTATDTQGIYDKIKDFLTEYNTVINEITKLYNANTAKGYEPLTDEEREAMSDEQIEKWENKIKDSILRRDSSLGAIMNTMINAMSQSFTVNGEKLSLGNFGIQTLGFMNAAQNEQYAYHIDGDEDDAKTSGKEDKLMKAIQEDPDQILGFMKQLTENLYTAIDKKMKSTELSSAYKVYNDKEIDREQKEIEELIKKWEEKVAAEEDRYYKQFSQMESALAKLQSQTSALSGLLGQ